MFSFKMYCQMFNSVQFESGNTRMLSPECLRVLYIDHISGRWFFGSQRWSRVRNEKIRSTERDFPHPVVLHQTLCRTYALPACLSASVTITSVWRATVGKGSYPCRNTIRVGAIRSSPIRHTFCRIRSFHEISTWCRHAEIWKRLSWIKGLNRKISSHCLSQLNREKPDYPPRQPPHGKYGWLKIRMLKIIHIFLPAALRSPQTQSNNNAEPMMQSPFATPVTFQFEKWCNFLGENLIISLKVQGSFLGTNSSATTL